MAFDQMNRNRETTERMQYHDVFADSLRIINSLYASSPSSNSMQERNAKQIEIRNWITAQTILNQKRGNQERMPFKQIAQDAQQLADKEPLERYVAMMDAMAKAKMMPVDLRRYFYENEAPPQLKKQFIPKEAKDV